ncbi:MAG: hypothetical protein K2O35_00895, partial [Clostridia bacterium]|nr:hypothetical protein [Clostridia bacterium]
MNCKRRRNKVLVLTICIILLLSLLFVTMLANFCYIDKEADAVTNYGNTTHIGKLTLDNYESNSNGKVFDSDKLSALYNALLGNNKKTLADVNAELLNGNINSANFRVNNSGKNDVVVEIGGMNWAAVYLSKNRNNEPILTLWLASSNEIKDANYRTAQWNTYASTTKGDYPGNMYATSKLRAVGLNNGGKYATSPTAFDGVAVQDKDSPFAIFTMPNSMAAGKEVSGSLIDFIDAPQNVEWQEFEEGVGIDRVDCNYENDAYSKTVTGFNTRYRSDNMTTCANYSDWQTDTLWIPSIAEMGYGSYGNGMWQRSSELYSDANSYWLRSASYTNYKDAMYQTGAGCSSNSSYSVRPAFHLNLAKADSASLALLDLPKNATMEYTSERIGVHSLSTLPTWYKSSVYDSSTLMTTIYKNSAGSAVSGGLPKDEGEYTVEFTLTATGKNKYCWKDSATNKSDTRSITFKITLKPIKYTLSGGGVSLPKVEHDVSNLGVNDTKLAQGTVLGFRYTGLYGSSYDDTKLPTVNGTYRATVISLNHNYTPDLSISPNYKDFTVEGARANVPTFNTVSQGYDGGNAVSFVLNGFDSAQMEVVMPLPSGVNYNGGEIITANRAGKYKIKIALKNKDGSIYWNSLE